MNFDLVKTGKYLRTLLPKRLVMSREYFDAIRLNHAAETTGVESCRPELEKRLRRVLTEAVEHVPHYRGLPITVRDCLHADPFVLIREFPFLTKNEVMENKDAFISSHASRLGMYEVTSGGSTGQGISLWRTKKLADVETAFFDHEWGKLGWCPGKSRIVRIGADARRKADEYPVWRDRNRLMVSPYHLSDRWLAGIHEDIARFDPEFIHAYPSCAVELAKFIRRTERAKIPLRGLLLASEPLLRTNISLLQSVFDCTISVNYGLTERTNIAFATVPPGQTDLHYRINPVYGYQENFQHEDGRSEIVGTSYWNTFMPLIRYRTGDFGEIAGHEIHNMDGRDQEFLITRTGSRIPGLSIVIDEYTWAYVSQYQIFQKNPGEIEIRVVLRTNCSPEILDKILASQKGRWGGFFDITLRTVPEIPRTRSGKNRLVVREFQTSS